MSLADALARHTPPEQGRAHWRVQHFRPQVPEEAAQLQALLESGGVRQVEDRLLEQLRALVECRHPRLQDARQVEALARGLLGGVPPEAWGCWVYYPWSGRLVHVLPEADFVEVRTSRNRNKLTPQEQERLAGARIGVVGLSVGHSTALTLALEGVGGLLRLADFDTLCLSNLNRLRAGLHQLGLNKAVLTARDILELNPYARLEVFPEGVTEENLEAFLTGGGGLTLLVEECDDLYLKVLLRERARALRLPVLMETSDRGLVDVERFDLEPERPLLHGLLGGVEARSLKGLSTADKVPFVLDILGVDTLSPRFCASLVEIDRTLRTWPQLASAVALGGALNTDVARRLLLGHFRGSGRYYVDLEALICQGQPPLRPPTVPPGAQERPPRPPALPSPRAPLPERVRALVAWGTLAPSGGNVQPWRFVFRDGLLHCHVAPERADTFLDFQAGASALAVGAAVENMALVAPALGLEVAVEPAGEGEEGTRVCTLALREAAGLRAPEPLAAHVATRTTNRRLAPRQPLPAGAAGALQEAACARGAGLLLLEAPGALGELGALVGRAERLRLLHPRMHREMVDELRWTAQQARATCDGLDVATLELSETDLAGLRVATSAPAMQLLCEWEAGSALEEGAHKALAAASAAGLVHVPAAGGAQGLVGGRALQRVWLTAQALGLALHPLTVLVWLLARLEAGGEGFSAREVAQLEALAGPFRRLFPLPAGRRPLFLFRLARAPAPTARSLRRPVEAVLELEWPLQRCGRQSSPL